MDLATSGEKKILWAKGHMPVLAHIEKRFAKDRPLEGHRISMALHLEAKTGVLALLLQTGGAEVTVSGSNPLSTQDDVAEALRQRGLRVLAKRGVSVEEYRGWLKENLRTTRPTLIVDDGGDLLELLHGEMADLAGHVFGGAEETTTGITRIKALEKKGELRIPMMAVNDARLKHLFDNRYGTGQSVMEAFMRVTNLIVAGQVVVVVGYGWCGKGVAEKARGLGARVVVTEVDPVKALEAHMDGFSVMPLEEAAAIGDIFITVTGGWHVISHPHFRAMKDGAFLANAGHFDVEIDIPALEEESEAVEEVRPHVRAYRQKDGRTLYLLAEGRLLNLAAGDGHPAEIMDLSFALQALAVEHWARMAASGKKPEPRLYPVPDELDYWVARMKLESLGIAIDRLTDEQEAYLARWR